MIAAYNKERPVCRKMLFFPTLPFIYLCIKIKFHSPTGFIFHVVSLRLGEEKKKFLRTKRMNSTENCSSDNIVIVLGEAIP